MNKHDANYANGKPVEDTLKGTREFNLSSKIREIGMKLAEEEQNLILEKYGLTELNKEQINGIVELIRYINRVHEEKFRDFIKKLKNEFRQNTNFPKEVTDEIIDTLAGSELSK